MTVMDEGRAQPKSYIVPHAVKNRKSAGRQVAGQFVKSQLSPLDRKPATMAAIQSQSEVAVEPARTYGAIAVWAAVWFAVVLSMAVNLCAQEATDPMHTGVPQDWSQQHIVFSRNALAQHPELIYREPRVLHQAMQRWQAPNFGVFDGSEPVPASANTSGPHRDWSVNPLGGPLTLNMYPAKFAFNPGAPPDCTNDYVVFGLNITSTGARANLVAFNNLYAGTTPTTGLCGTVPKVMFAYDITTAAGGKIATSPILSQDGKKIAFVESVPAPTPASIFHVLTWTAGQGKIGTAAAPPAFPSWVSITLPGAKNDLTSSPWIDYFSDTAYVGSATGYVYEITGVFRGTPTLVVTPPWTNPLVAVALTSPVLDSRLGMLMVGGADGILYQINTTNGAVAKLVVGKGLNRGILAAPIVDVTNGTTFVVSSNKGNGTYAVLVEADTATLGLLAEANIGQGSSGGTAVDLYQPALDNNYYNDPSTGLIHLCGTDPLGTLPWQYAFGFTVPPLSKPIMNTAASVAQAIPTFGNAAAGCTGWTEFFNPNIGTGGTDFFFFGLTQNCTAALAAGGCVEEIGINGGTPTTITANINGGPTGVIVDNYSTAAQASSIYFAARSANIAYKLTQSGLN